MERFQPISLKGLPPAALMRALRVNCLGNLFYFIKHALGRKRLTESFHEPFCRTLERKHLKDVIEIPRDHFKSTCGPEGLTMWRVLPISQQDIDEFFQLGYSNEFIRWMLYVHNPDLRNLLISENITNAAKLGRRIRWHYESNAVYRSLFPETLPDTSCTWTDYSLHVKRPKNTAGGAHGEGTFDFLGVGSAVQSRHYTGLIIEDDLIGRKATESPSIMDKSIEYHQLLVGIFEMGDNNKQENDELIIGNRWGYTDLNSHIREHEPWFRVASHSAMGGCCDAHPSGVPIFPEEFSFEKLEKLRKRLGSYNFSCQFLNSPCAPEDADFQVEWLNYFELAHDEQGRMIIRHEERDGIVREDIKIGHLALAEVVDPNHSGQAGTGRCRHAILVVGESDKGDYYVLDAWAQGTSYDVFYNKIFEMAAKFKLRRVGCETVGAQRYVKHHIEFLGGLKGQTLRVDELKGEVEAPDGTLSRKKEWRIRNVIGPIAERGQLWVQRKHQDFVTEYQTFPRGRFCDQIDVFAYAPQMLRKPVDWATQSALMQANEEAMQRIGTPYSYGMARHN